MSAGRNNIVLGFASIAIAAIGFAAFNQVSPRWVWNGSASAPIGLYRIDDKAAKIGEFVLVEASGRATHLIAARQYLPPGTPLIKRVVAQKNDEICRETTRVFINRLHVSDALLVDSLGREMPRWSGCFTLRDDEIFLVNEHEKSLDGRYFGATKLDDVVGVAIPVFVRQ